MKILSISAQKPDSTGSGIYLTELVKAFSKKGHEQAVMAGIGPEDQVELPSGVSFYPVRFETDALPFPVAGMSDEMPYKSTRYQDLTPEMVRQFQESFLGTLDRILAEFDPDVILCHHLYLLTAFVRRHCPDRKIYGFCHNTDLRQMEKTDLERAFIAEEIRKLDGIFTLQEAQTERVRQIYHVDRNRIHVVGIGYNDKIFTQKQFVRTDERVTMVYAGKIAEKKGVKSLLRALGKLCLEKDPSAAQNVRVFLAGGAGNQTEYEEICRMAGECPCRIEFAGKLGQQKLAELYNACDLFVLPSFYEGLPLTPVEALACGDRVVMTDLPGIRDWMKTYAPDAGIRFVTPPKMKAVDEPEESGLAVFEEQLAEALDETAAEVKAGGRNRRKAADLSRIRWEQVAARVEAVILI